MINDELARARAELQVIGAEWALLTSPENVTYVSHYEVPVDYGPLAHLSYGPVVALFGVNEPASVLVANRYYADAAARQSAFDEAIGFGILEVFEPFAPQVARDNFTAALRQALRRVGLSARPVKLAIEERTLPWLRCASFRRNCRRPNWSKRGLPWRGRAWSRPNARWVCCGDRRTWSTSRTRR
jgi:hypothetical protein